MPAFKNHNGQRQVPNTEGPAMVRSFNRTPPIFEQANTTAPVLISSGQTVWNVGTTPKTVGVDVENGDILVAFASMESGNDTIAISGGGLTWALQQSDNHGTASEAAIYIWTTAATSKASFSVSFSNAGTNRFGGCVMVFRGSAGVGTSATANNTTGSGLPSVSITPAAHSAVVVASVDWNAVDGAARNWIETAGAFSDKAYQTTATFYTSYGGYHSDVPGGTVTVGLNSPGAQRYGIVALEVLGQAVAGGPSAIAETSAITDTVSAINTATATISETSAITDTTAATITTGATIAETAAITDTTDATIGKPVTIAETAAITDTVSSTISTPATIAETSAITDTVSATFLATATIAETAAITDTVSATASTTATIAEASAIADTTSATISTPATIAETAAITETVSATASTPASIAESSAITDTTDATIVSGGVSSQDESAAITDTVSAITIAVAAMAETVAITDATDATAIYQVAMAESAAISDTTDATISLAGPGAIAESVAITDTVDATILYAPSTSGGSSNPRHGTWLSYGPHQPAVRVKVAAAPAPILKPLPMPDYPALPKRQQVATVGDGTFSVLSCRGNSSIRFQSTGAASLGSFRAEGEGVAQSNEDDELLAILSYL